MSITEVSILHHVGLVLALLWSLASFNCCYPIFYIIALIYLYQVHERYIMKLKRKLEFEERRQSQKRRVLCDSETVRWLNHAIEKIWPVCMEHIVSQKLLLPIIPWFLQKFKPWTVKKATVQHLYMGRNPPLFTEFRVRQTTDDDHLVLELGLNFLTAEDMSAILAVKMSKRLGFGMRAKVHLTGMHVEGKVLIGVKFLPKWPFLSRLRVCFVEPPYCQLTVKPISTHGLDVTELPGIAGWLDKLLGIVFEQTLVEPNMLVVDVEKLTSSQSDNWFCVDEKETVAHAKVEVIEASDMKPSDSNGLADPYVKAQLGPYKFTTKIQRKTLSPRWHEEYKIPIFTWDSPNLLIFEVCDKDHFIDDTLGNCSVAINDLRGGQRHDMWLPLQNVKVGRLHLAITILEDNGKEPSMACHIELPKNEDIVDSPENEAGRRSYLSSSLQRHGKVPDSFESVDVEGQQETGIWVQQPGSDVPQSWESRKGKARVLDSHVAGVTDDPINNPDPDPDPDGVSSGLSPKPESSLDGDINKVHGLHRVRVGLHKIGSVFHRSPSSSHREPSSSPGIKVENSRDPMGDGSSSTDGSGPDSPVKRNMKDKAMSFLSHAGRSAQGLKHVLSHKGSRSRVQETSMGSGSGSSDDESRASSIKSQGAEKDDVLNDATDGTKGDC